MSFLSCPNPRSLKVYVLCLFLNGVITEKLLSLTLK